MKKVIPLIVLLAVFLISPSPALGAVSSASGSVKIKVISKPETPAPKKEEKEVKKDSSKSTKSVRAPKSNKAPAKKTATTPVKKSAPAPQKNVLGQSTKKAVGTNAPANNSNQDIEQLKKKITELEQSQAANQLGNKKIVANEINPDDYNDYLTGVVRVACGERRGSGFLWNIPSIGYTVFTNRHVIENNYKIICNIYIYGSGTGQLEKIYEVPATNFRRYNDNTDFAILTITQADGTQYIQVENNNYKLSGLQRCDVEAEVGTPVIVAGFPSTTNTRTITRGIITGYDNTDKKPYGKLPYANYFVDATIDTGNSGGVALSKSNNGLCLLGMPTWVSKGTYTVMGVVQNIHNIFYIPTAEESAITQQEENERTALQQRKNVISATLNNLVTWYGGLYAEMEKEIEFLDGIQTLVIGRFDAISSYLWSVSTTRKTIVLNQETSVLKIIKVITSLRGEIVNINSLTGIESTESFVNKMLDDYQVTSRDYRQAASTFLQTTSNAIKK